MRSFVFFSGLFYKTLFVSLLISAAAKTVVNFRIDPIGPNVSLPSGRFAITHAENRHDGWPDYCDGLFGTISCNTSDLIGNVVAADNLEMIFFIALVALVVVPVSLSTIGQNRSGLIPKYAGMGLIFAGGISNEGEIALLDHATDFLYFRVDIFSYHRFFIANLADTMILVGFLLVIVAPAYQKFVASLETAEPQFRSDLESEFDQP